MSINMMIICKLFIVVIICTYSAGYDHNQIFKQGQALHFGHHLAHQCREKIRHDVVRCMRESGQQYNEDNRREMCCYIWTAQDCAKREAKAKCTSVEKRALEENVWKNVHQYNENDCEEYHYHAITCSGAPSLASWSFYCFGFMALVMSKFLA